MIRSSGKSQKILNQSGISILEVMIATTLVGIMMAAVGTMTFNSTKAARNVTLSNEINDIGTQISLALADETRCSTALTGKAPGVLTTPLVLSQNSSISAGTTIGGNVQITSIKLTHKQVLNTVVVKEMTGVPDGTYERSLYSIDVGFKKQKDDGRALSFLGAPETIKSISVAGLHPVGNSGGGMLTCSGRNIAADTGNDIYARLCADMEGELRGDRTCDIMTPLCRKMGGDIVGGVCTVEKDFCERSGGKWDDSKTPKCDPCFAAGGSWDAATGRCDVKQRLCEEVGGVFAGNKCNDVKGSLCRQQGGTYDETTKTCTPRIFGTGTCQWHTLGADYVWDGDYSVQCGDSGAFVRDVHFFQDVEKKRLRPDSYNNKIRIQCCQAFGNQTPVGGSNGGAVAPVPPPEEYPDENDWKKKFEELRPPGQ